MGNLLEFYRSFDPYSHLMEREEHKISIRELCQYLEYKGGVNTWVPWVFGILLLVGILTAILIPMFANK